MLTKPYTMDKNTMICVLAAIIAGTIIIMFKMFGVAVGLTVASIIAVFGIGGGLYYINENLIDSDDSGSAFFVMVMFVLWMIKGWFSFLITLFP